MDFPFAFLAAGPESLKIALAMLIVIGTARLLDELFEWFNQPGLAGQILAGVVIGPGVLNWLQPSDFLAALAELGVLFLLFRVGLEVKPAELLQVGGTAMLVGVLGVAAPFLAVSHYSSSGAGRALKPYLPERLWWRPASALAHRS